MNIHTANCQTWYYHRKSILDIGLKTTRLMHINISQRTGKTGMINGYRKQSGTIPGNWQCYNSSHIVIAKIKEATMNED